MQTENRLFDDLARMANGALNTLSGLREEIENRVRERVERMLAEMDMVPREEFEAVRAMAQTARSEQEDLATKVAELERRLGELQGAGPAAANLARTSQANLARTSQDAAPAAAERARTSRAAPAGTEQPAMPRRRSPKAKPASE